MKISNKTFVYQMDKNHSPVAHVDAGDILTFETHDCFQGQLTCNTQQLEDVNFAHINPATGPVYVNHAEEGDALIVDILAIKPSQQAVTVAVPGLGLLGKDVKQAQTEIVKLAHGYAYYQGLMWPLSPMIGVIGVAPAGDPVPCGTPGPHGGNLDCKDIKVGSRLFLPISVTGALLALGDVHALQGDGEICGTGLECAAEVTVRIGLKKHAGIPIPFIETEQEIMAVGTGQTIHTAAQVASQALLHWMMQHKSFSYNQAYMLLSACMDLRICQTVNPLMSVRAVISKHAIY